MGCKLYAWEWPGHQPFCNLLFRFVAIRIAYYIYVSAYLSVQCKWAVNNSNNNKNNHDDDDDDDNDNEEKTRIADRYIYSVHIFHQCSYNEDANLLLINDFPILCVYFLKKIGFWLVDLCMCLSVFQTFVRLFWHSVDSFRTQKNSLKNELFLPLLLPVIRYHFLYTLYCRCSRFAQSDMVTA